MPVPVLVEAALPAAHAAALAEPQSEPQSEPERRAARSALLPDRVSVQSAWAEDTEAISVGLQWMLVRGWKPTPGLRIDGYFEFAMGRWRARAPDGTSSWAWVSQFSLVPVLRVRRGEANGPYVEVGIGPSYLTPVYTSRDTRFSSRFQFRDHLAVGFTWGHDARHDLSVRIEHFSNAGIEDPNPGINLIGLRYTRRF